MAEVNCFGKTENYSDKITLLNTYDTNNNGRIDAMENMQAIADWKAGKITAGERDIITACWKLGEDGISKFCPGTTPPGGVTPPAYLTPDDALLRIRAGEKCYIKCTLPILDMLPGIPYTPGAWVPPFCAITGEP